MEQTIKAYASTLSSPRRQCWLTCKRLIDVASAGLGLIILGPALLVLAILIRLDSPGPAIFTQQRLGRYGRVFTLYKFRSMQNGAPVQLNADGSTRVVDDDPRVTRLGHFLRRTAIDELPQLINVLKGDMSLVGPRPDPAFYEQYYHGNDYYKLTVRPGLTALAHVLGRQTIGWRNRFPIERVYVERFSPLLDIKIMLLTILVLWNNVGATNSARICTSSAALRRRVSALTHPPRLLVLRASGKFLAAMIALVLLVPMIPTQSAHATVRGPVKPVLECVANNGDGTYTAWFGYDNRNDYQIDIAIGNRNKFHPAPQDRGQPASFLAGRQRAVFAVDFTGNTLVWSLDNRTSTASRNSSPCPEPAPEPAPAPATPLDFNSDGKSDILWRDTVTGSNALWLMDGASTITTLPINQLSDTDWNVAAVHDFNRDTYPDIFWRHNTSGANAVWFMNGVEFGAAAGMNTLTDTNWRMIGLADFNQDGAADILWRHAEHGWNVAWLLDEVTFTDAAGLQEVRDTNWEIMGLHDINQDGTTDLLWRHATTGVNAIWYMQGTGIASGAGLNRVSDPDWRIVGVDDFNGDEQIDLLWRHATTGANALWYMDGHTLLSAISLNQISDTDWYVAAVHDINGDGNPDLLWRHATEGYNAVWFLDSLGNRTAASLNTLSDMNWRPVGANVPQFLRPAVAPHTLTMGSSDEVAISRVEAIQNIMPDEPPADLMMIDAPGELMPIDAPVEQAESYTPETSPDTIPDSVSDTVPTEPHQIYIPLVRQ